MSSNDNVEDISSSAIKSDDPGWKYCIPTGKGTNKVQCKFCSKVMCSGITRGKEHLMGKKGRVSRCEKCPKEVRAELWAHYRAKENEAIEKEGFQKSEGIDLGGLGFSDEDDEEAVRKGPGSSSQARVSQSKRKSQSMKGPMDLFCRNPDASIEKRKKEKLRQTSIKEAVDKEAVARVHQYIARFWYQAGLSFNTITLESFEEMVEAIGSYGRGLPIPSYHDMRVGLLNKELDFTNNLMKNHREEWYRYGCTIMSDGWTDRRQRTVINFLVNSPSGSMFIKSVDASGFVKTGQKIFELLDSVVEEIGEENVLQVVTDNGSNYVSAGKLLMEKRKHLYWTPCAAHCIDLMLEDIGKLPLIKKTIKLGVSLVGFIYSHGSTLSLLRQSTNKRELVRPAITRFATSFLSLERIHKEKANLRRMFTSEEWTSNKLSKEAKGKQATKTVLAPTFWRNVVYTLKVMAPLVRVLRLVDGDKKPAMGYIYEAMEKAKETIMKSFKEDESRYKDVFKIIDHRWDCQLHQPLHAAGHFLNPEIFYSNPDVEFDMEITNGLYACFRRLVASKDDQEKIMYELTSYKNRMGLFADDFGNTQLKKISPAQWWRSFGHSAPTLQKLAIKILSLTCSASGCERNWSVFEQIHSKKRNRLDHKKMHELVYIKYNQKLHKRRLHRDELDPISLDDIDECNEWLVGEMDDEDDLRNDYVFDDGDTLDWETVLEASGIGEPTKHTRSTTGKRKETTLSKDVRAPKKGASSSTTKGKGKKSCEIVDDDESLEVDDEEDEYVGNGEESDGEEGEGAGFAKFDNNEEDDYVGVDEED